MSWFPRFVAVVSAACLAGAVHLLPAQDDTPPTKPIEISPLESADSEIEPSAEIPAEEQPFWDSAKAFVNAYAKRDAAAIGEMFTEDAEFRDEFGERTVGREAIVELFKGVFESNGETLIEGIEITEIRYISSEVVLEEGVVYVTDTLDDPVQSNKYVALHVKGLDDVWRINTLKDLARAPLGKNEHLDQLEWLIGEWVNEDVETLVETSCRWSDDGNYLLRRYQVETIAGQEMDGVQRIAWDPMRKQIRSWTFDSEGGFRESCWHRDGSQWIVNTTGTTANGRAVHASSVYNIVDPERIIWEISSLVIGNEIIPEGHAVVMMRKPPEPLTADSTSDK